MVLSKQAVTKCKKNKVFIVPQIKQKIQPMLKINNDIEKVYTMTFLGVLLDANLSWKEHMKYLENKLAKNIGRV